MPRPSLLLSHQLGGYDGVSVEAAKWATCLRDLGHHVTRVAGYLHDQQPGDLLLPCLWRPNISGDAPAPTRAEIEALRDFTTSETVVAVDNIFTYPTAPQGILKVADTVTQAGLVLVRHHDAAWEQPGRRSHPAFPLNDRSWRHIAISTHLKENLKQRRDIYADVVFNPVDTDALQHGDRNTTRSTLGLTENDLLFLHPVSTYPRKNIAGAMEFLLHLTQHIGKPVHYWLTGAPQDLVVPEGVVLHSGRANNPADMYAAADAVLLPSTWEGWGNPVAEAGVLGLPVITGDWPALSDMRGLGLRDIPVNHADAITRVLTQIETGAPHDRDTMRDALSVVRFQESIAALLR